MLSTLNFQQLWTSAVLFKEILLREKTLERTKPYGVGGSFDSGDVRNFKGVRKNESIRL